MALNKEELIKMLEAMPLNELYYIRNRYCGWSNRRPCEEKFGRMISEKLVDEIIIERLLLSDSTH